MSKINGIFFILAGLLFILSGFEVGSFGLLGCGILFPVMGIINLLKKNK